MQENEKPKRRRSKRRVNGSGTVYRQGRIWWFAYKAPNGERLQESSGTTRRRKAEQMLQKRLGARANGLPVIPNVERLRFEDAAKSKLTALTIQGKKSIKVVQRRIDKHLMPFFYGVPLVAITADLVRAYVAKRQADTIVVRKERHVRLNDGETAVVPAKTKPVSPANINRELEVLKSILMLAISEGKLAMKPKIAMLREDNVRTGFFEREQYASVRKHLPPELRPLLTFAYITGWRMANEVFPLEWRQVDFAGGEIRLDAGKTKNAQGRVFPMTAELRTLLQAQHAEHERLKKAGHITPKVFVRLVAEGRGGEPKPRPIRSITKAWRVACRAAGCPGRIPHDLRRTAVRNLVRAGIPERVAMQMTGHKTRSVFERYNIVSEGDLKDAARRLDNVAALTV